MAVLQRWYDRACLYATNATWESTTTLGSASISFASQPLTIALLTSTYTFAATHNVYADLTNELTTSGGYTLGGQAVSTVAVTQASAVTNVTGLTVTWTA